MENDLIHSSGWTDSQKNEARKLTGPILIVGASGFIGANLFYALHALREDVYACSRHPRRSWRLSGVAKDRLIDMDITDFGQVQSVIHQLRPQTVFNLSAYGAYARQTDPERIHQTNYIGTMNLLRSLSETGCNAFIQAGTSSEYGLNCSAPSEKSELIPNSEYAVSKTGAGYLIKYYGKVHGFPCANLRLYSVYGPWEERDRLIPVVVTHGLRGRLPNLVGKDISRDFVYVDDATHALVRAALTLCKTHPGMSVNIATGLKTTMEDVAAAAKKIFGITEEPLFGSMANRRWDLQEWYGDPVLAKELMDWTFSTRLEEGLKRTAEWQKAAEEKVAHAMVPVMEKKISAIVACYRDEQSIPVLYERLTSVFRKSGCDYEIIFVNDHSPADDEGAIANLCYTDHHVIGISHSRNFGSQSAFISGMEIASGDAVVLMDGDGQDPPEVIPDFIHKWNEGFEVVFGQRVKRKAPVYMQLLYKVFYRVFRKVSDITIPVDAGDFSLIDRKAVDYLLAFSEKDVFLRGLRAWIGFRQTGVEYVRPERLFGRSTNSFLKNIWWAKKGIFSFSTKPLQYIQAIGVTVFILTVLLAIFYLVLYFIQPPENARGITTVILIMLGLGGVQLISISILGDYIAKIMEEVKNRPKFIREKLIVNGKIYQSKEEMGKILRELEKQKEF